MRKTGPCAEAKEDQNGQQVMCDKSAALRLLHSDGPAAAAAHLAALDSADSPALAKGMSSGVIKKCVQRGKTIYQLKLGKKSVCQTTTSRFGEHAESVLQVMADLYVQGFGAAKLKKFKRFFLPA